MKPSIPTLVNGRQQSQTRAIRKPSSLSHFLATLQLASRHKRTAKLFGFFAAMLVTLQSVMASYTVTLEGFGSYNPVGIHLDNPAGNDLNTLFPGASDSDSIFLWDCTTQDFAPTVPTYIAGMGQWIPNLTLTPGQGVFYVNQGATRTATLNGNPITPVYPPPQDCGCDKRNMLANQTATVASWGSLMGAPPINGSQFIKFDVIFFDWVTNKYDNCAWTLGEPAAAVGEAVWVVVPCTNSTPCLPCTNNLVINGSFENPNIGANTVGQLSSIPGWTAIGPGGPTTLEIWSGNFFSMTPQDGNQHLEINSATNNVVVSQVITNVSTNCTAKFCFWYAGRAGHTPNNFVLQILGSGLSAVSFNPPPYTGPSSWQQYCVEFTPQSSVLTIRFTGTSGAALAGAHIDNVSLMQCCTNPPCNEPLVVNCSTNKTVNCGSAWQFDAPTASSPCCGTNITIIPIATWTNGLCPKIATRIWQITDCFTNSTTCTQIVTVVDTTLPVVKCPGTVVTYTCATSNRVYFSATAKDACSGTLPVTYSHASGSLFPVGNTTVTVTATDACGNVGSCSFVVSVKQYTLPGWRTLGIKDNGTLPIETALRSSYLNSLYSGTWNNFDTKYAGRPFAASFLKLPKNLTCATLEIWMKPYKKSIFSTASQNDTLTISAGASIIQSSLISSLTTLGSVFTPWGGLFPPQTGFQKYTRTFSLAELNTINSKGQLDIYVQDSTIVDYAKLTYCYCFDLDNIGPFDTATLNAAIVHGPYFTSLKPIPDPTNYTATVLAGSTKGMKLGLPVKQLGFLTNATLSASAEVNGQSTPTTVTLTGVGNGNVNLALSSIPAEVTQLQLTLKRNGVIVGQSTQPASNGTPSIVIMNDGVEVASGQQGLVWMEDMWKISTFANLGSSGQDGVSIGNIGSSGQDGVESIIILEDGVENIGSSGQGGVEFNIGSSGQDGIGSSGQDGVEFTVRMRNPSSIQSSVLPATLADTVTLKLVNPNHNSDTMLTGLTLGADGLSEVQLSGAAVKMGDLWMQSIGDVTTAADGDQVSVNAHDPSATNRWGIIIHLPVTNAASINLNELNNSTASNGIVNVAAYGIVGSNLVDVARASIIGDDWGWGITSDFSGIGSSNVLYQVYSHGVQVASCPSCCCPHVPVLPIRMSTSDSGAIWTYEWASDGIIAINGSNYLGNELRITAVSPAALPTSVRFIGIGSSGQDGVSIAGKTPAPDWTVMPLEWNADDLDIQWTGPRGGALESAPALNGPWAIVPNQNAYSATMPSPESTNAAPAQFFRVRSN